MEIQEIKEVYAAGETLRHESSAKMVEVLQLCTDSDPHNCTWHKGDEITEADEHNSRWVAKLYMSDQVIRVVEMAIVSSEGQWAIYPKYYFRSDGALAFIYSEEPSDGNIFRAESRSFYNKDGKRIRLLERFSDTNTGKPRHDVTLKRHDIPVYLTIRDLLKALTLDPPPEQKHVEFLGTTDYDQH